MQKKVLTSLKKAIDLYNSYQAQYREVSVQSDELRRTAKRVIFYISKNESQKASDTLRQASELLDQITALVSDPQILYDNEGYKVASEEYLEACLTYMIMSEQELDLSKVKTTVSRRLGAYSDLCGELARSSILLACDGQTDKIRAIRDFIQELLLEMSKTKIVENSYLRSKYDQAEKALRKVENVLYDLKLRQGD